MASGKTKRREMTSGDIPACREYGLICFESTAHKKHGGIPEWRLGQTLSVHRKKMQFHSVWCLRVAWAPVGGFLLVWSCGASAGALQWGGPGFMLLISGQDCDDPYLTGVGLLHVFMRLHFLYTHQLGYLGGSKSGCVIQLLRI